MTAKAVKQEEIKLAKDGLAVWDDIRGFAERGYEAIGDDDFERLKWFGVYRHKPNNGHFMVRIKMPAGRLTAAQLRETGRLALDYGRDLADVTTRQDIQLHWVTIENVPDLLDRIYNTMGLYQEFSCGDAPRNTTACPLAGELADEIVDASGYAQAIADLYKSGGREFSNLPRKFKTAVGGCPNHCHLPQLNDLAFFGARAADGRRGFGVCVGGGLRDTPAFSQSLRVFVPPDRKLILDISREVAHIFRDCEQLRHGRLRARLKFYVAEIGWQAFRDQLEQYLGYPLEHDERIIGPTGAGHDDHLGVGRMKNGMAYVGIPVPRGRLSGGQLVAVADLAESYCRHPERQVNTTIKQNLILLNVEPGQTAELMARLGEIGLPVEGHPARRQLISCTGTQFCNLAVVETKDRAASILDYLEQHVPMETPLFISVTGCPNSCAQYQLADIGLQGVLYTWRGQKGVEHYHVLVGGRLGDDPQFARFVTGASDKKIKVPAELIHLAIERLVRAWQGERRTGESFSQWGCRQEMSRLAELITLPEIAEV